MSRVIDAALARLIPLAAMAVPDEKHRILLEAVGRCSR
jgi:hypothetical protein